jgi:5'-nucleotidase
LRTISVIQGAFSKEEAPIRTALVTARNAPSHERVIRTLRAWNVRIDEAFFLGGIEKSEILKAFNANIFFDDQTVHTDPASKLVPSARVPYRK